ncbi:T9SS type B sorting domain-containing protein [Mesonia aquimarina]|uniref:T9SS type B sorting domain-containing protein n=1 Tax=Mesonia aquimarina TaxID=1504967 RepID=UPI000EF5E8E2|nr:T9SS type B sorting domain-containing protein [Mesonia aquimarina]
MKFYLLILFSLLFSITFSQSISVNNNNSPADELINFLINDGCIEISNAEYSSPLSVSSFNNNEGSFPISEGIIIRSGEANFSEGIYTGNNLSSQINTQGDEFLQSLVENSGQDVTITDVAYLEFDFIPLSNSFSFNFLFASNEYGEWQCVSNDAIAFVLTNLNTQQSQNLAVLPSSTIPISVKNIRNNLYNNSCSSENPSLFNTYVVSDPNASTLNMRGYTNIMTASANINSGDPYRLRFIIGDSNDSDYDSAIFIEAGSFETTLDLGEDQRLCPGEIEILDTGLNSNIYDHTWILNGEIINGENSSTLEVSQGGTYELILNNNNGNCEVSDQITFTDTNVIPPTDLNLCFSNGGYIINLINRIYFSLSNENIDDFEWSFFTSLDDAQNNVNAIENPLVYVLFPNFSEETIWIRLHTTDGSDCLMYYSFDIIENPLPETPDIESVVACSSYTLPEINNGTYRNSDGEELEPGYVVEESGTYLIIVGPDENGCSNQTDFYINLIDEYNLPELSCGEYTVPVPPVGGFYTAIDGPSGNGTEIPGGTILEDTTTLYYYAEIDGVICQNTPYTIEIEPLPQVDDLENVLSCSPYVLQELTNGKYYTNPDGQGQILEPGTTIYSSRNIYIFADDGTCTNQNNFLIKIVNPKEDVTECGEYILPNITQPNVTYRTAPEGQGFEIEGETVITNSQTIYIYAESAIDPNCTDFLSFNVTILELPPVDQLDDVSLACEEDFYILPELQNGEYFTEPEGEGTQLFAGTILTEPQTIYIYNDDGTCTNNSSFEIIDNPLPLIENFSDVYTCEPFELPTLPVGNFYTEPNGNGTLLNPGEIINETQTIYIYLDNGENSPCFQEKTFTIYVIGIEVEDFENVEACNNYILPNLSIGNYFTEPGGEGTQLAFGKIIETSQTIYIYAENGDRFTCEDESSFSVTISETPELSIFEDIEICEKYMLPNLSNNLYTVNYYRAPNKVDLIEENEYLISTPGQQTIYVYAESNTNSNCFIEKNFNLTIHPLLNLSIEGGTLCFDTKTGKLISELTLYSNLNPNEFIVNWYLNQSLVHTGSSFNAKQSGKYTVITEKLTDDIGGNCNYKPTQIIVEKSAKPIIKVKQTQDFADSANINVIITNGVGEYLYQLDNKPFQTSAIFKNVTSGIHSITVKGKTGNCGETSTEVLVLKYPKFFTPNNDGYNDYWNIEDLYLHKEAVIYIHDRFGKLLTTINPQEKGWNGFYNNTKMPSNDYWFRVTYEINGEPREFVANFTLKR